MSGRSFRGLARILNMGGAVVHGAEDVRIPFRQGRVRIVRGRLSSAFSVL